MAAVTFAHLAIVFLEIAAHHKMAGKKHRQKRLPLAA
jgi:hypothetical protein